VTQVGRNLDTVADTNLGNAAAAIWNQQMDSDKQWKSASLP
jgi:hypothetical protein